MYESILIICVLLFSSLYTCMPDKLQLKAPIFALRGATIKLSCIGMEPPNGNTAEFLVGDKTLTNVRIHDDTCFNTVQRRVCHPTECACDKNQKDYMMYYHTTEEPDTNLMFSCKMKFDNIITVSKIAVVTVIDAYFTIKDIASLLSVSEKTVKNRLKEFGLCVRMTYSNIDDDVLDSWIQRGLGLFPRAGAVGLEFICPFDPLLPWNIVGKGLGGVVSPDNWEIGKKRELAFPPVTYTLTVSFLQNITQGESSVKTCVTQKVHYTTYKIYHPALPSPLTSCEPIPSSQKYEELKNLSLLDSYSCNSSSSTVLICQNSDTKSEFGFYGWVHSYNSVFIRTLPGTVVDNGVSLLMFPTCSYHDYGDYTCRVWYGFGDEDKYEENKTTSLLVDAIPVILILDMSPADNSYEATYFSRTRIIAVQWFENRDTIINSTVYPHESQHVVVTLPIHGVMVEEQGYKTTLLVEERRHLLGPRVCVTNTAGTACRDMEQNKPDELKESVYNTNKWIILGTAAGGALVVIVVVVSVIIGLSVRKPREGKHQVSNRLTEQQTSISRNQMEMNTPQYHAIEEYERPVHPYDRPIRDVPLPRPPETAPVPGPQVTNTLPHTYIDVVDENDEYEKVD